jgi:hypothetical protein
MDFGRCLKNNLGLCNGDPLIATCEDPRKQLLLDRINLADVLFVDPATGFAMRHLQSRQLGLPPDE